MGDELAYAAAFPETQELHDLVERAFNPEDHVAVSDAEYEHVRASRKKLLIKEKAAGLAGGL